MRTPRNLPVANDLGARLVPPDRALRGAANALLQVFFSQLVQGSAGTQGFCVAQRPTYAAWDVKRGGDHGERDGFFQGLLPLIALGTILVKGTDRWTNDQMRRMYGKTRRAQAR